MKANHRVNVVRVGEIFPHPNADKLELTKVEGYQIVIGKGTFKPGDLAVYVPPDSVVPQTPPFSFIWLPHIPKVYVESLESVKSESVYAFGEEGSPEGTKFWIQPALPVPEKRRRITVKRLRKEYSEGLLMPIADLVDIIRNYVQSSGSSETTYQLTEGQDVADILGVTHYVPEFDRESTKADLTAAPRRRYPRTLRGWFYWTLYKLGFKGAGRSLALDVTFDYPVYDVDALKNRKNDIRPGDRVQVTEKIHGSNARYVFYDGVQYCGFRTQWKQDGPNVWWNAFRQFPEIGRWCEDNPGYVLYGEVGPTQKGFRYGAGDGETFFFAFDVWNPEAKTWAWAGTYGFSPHVPVVCITNYDEGFVKTLVDGPSLVPGAGHIREGVVLRKLEDGTTLKIVSNAFLEKDSQ